MLAFLNYAHVNEGMAAATKPVFISAAAALTITGWYRALHFFVLHNRLRREFVEAVIRAKCGLLGLRGASGATSPPA